MERLKNIASAFVRSMRGEPNLAPSEAPSTSSQGAAPLTPVLLFVPLLPLVLSGAIRFITGLPLSIALVLSLLPPGLWLLLRWRSRRARTRRDGGLRTAQVLRRIAVEGIAVVTAVIVAVRLFNPHFGGLLNLDGWDAGTHLFLQRAFVKADPNVYNGFVGQYAFTHWIETLLRVDGFVSVGASFYVAIAVVVVTSVSVAGAAAGAAARGRFVPALFGTTVAACVFVALSHRGFLPAAHYLQGMGFFPHLFGMIPFAWLWVIDVAVRGQVSRVAGFVVGIVLMRYSYGLNLPDAAAALGIVLVGGTQSGRSRLFAQAAGAGFVVLAALGYVALLPVFEIWGGIAKNNVLLMMAANLAIAGLLFGCSGVLAQPPDAHNGARLLPYLRFPLAMAFCNATALAYFQATVKQPYYINKYQLNVLWMLTAACGVAAAFLVASLAAVAESERGCRLARALARTVIAAAFVAAAFATGSHFWKVSLLPYWDGYLERVKRSGPPYVHLRPLIDRRAVDAISGILEQRKKRFGGYVTGNFPQFSFTVGMFNAHTGIQDFFPPKIEPGHCVFWVRPEDDAYPNGLQAPVLAWRRTLAANPEHVCESYRVPWKQTPQSLCWACL